MSLSWSLFSFVPMHASTSHNPVLLFLSCLVIALRLLWYPHWFSYLRYSYLLFEVSSLQWLQSGKIVMSSVFFSISMWSLQGVLLSLSLPLSLFISLSLLCLSTGYQYKFVVSSFIQRTFICKGLNLFSCSNWPRFGDCENPVKLIHLQLKIGSWTVLRSPSQTLLLNSPFVVRPAKRPWSSGIYLTVLWIHCTVAFL